MINEDKIIKFLENEKYKVITGIRNHGASFNNEKYKFIEFENKTFSGVIEIYSECTGSHYLILNESNEMVVCNRILQPDCDKIKKSVIEILNKIFLEPIADYNFLFNSK